MNGRTNPTSAAEAAAERELLRLCFVHAKDAAWAQWFYEEVYSRPGGKVAALVLLPLHGRDAK